MSSLPLVSIMSCMCISVGEEERGEESTILRESEIRTPPVDDLSYAIFVMRFIRPFALIIYFINNILRRAFIITF